MENIFSEILSFYPDVANTWKEREIIHWRDAFFEIHKQVKLLTMDYEDLLQKTQLLPEEFSSLTNWLVDNKVITIKTTEDRRKIVIIATIGTISQLVQSEGITEVQKNMLRYLEKKFRFKFSNVEAFLRNKGIDQDEIRQIYSMLVRAKYIRRVSLANGRIVHELLVSEQKFVDLDARKDIAYDHFCRVINSPDYITFVKAKEEYISSITHKSNAKQELPDEIAFILHLVEKFYEDKHKSCLHLTDIKNCLLNADNDGMNFYDIVTAKCWVDVMSALEYHLHLFSNNHDSFRAFLESFTSLYSKLNNRKYEAFHINWLSEICAVYIIFKRETYDEFSCLLNTLKETLKKEQKLSCDGKSEFDPDPRQYDFLREEIIHILEDNSCNVVDMLKDCIQGYSHCFVYEVGKIRGNVNFWDVLLEYPCFKDGFEAYKTCYKVDEHKKGRKSLQCSMLINYVIDLVKTMHLQQKKQFSSSSESSLKTCLINATEKGGFFYDTGKATQWINVLSALNYHLNIFSDDGDYNFGIFFSNYRRLYSKLNNSKTLAFYARNLPEILAMYTIFLKETVSDYNELLKGKYNLKKVLEGSQKKTDPGKISFGKTSSIEEDLLVDIFAYSKSDSDFAKSETIKTLSNYISVNPYYFAAATGNYDNRFRRFYCAIKDMLVWMQKNGIKIISNDELLDMFCTDADYQAKDGKVRELEYELICSTLDALSNTDFGLMFCVSPQADITREGFYMYRIVDKEQGEFKRRSMGDGFKERSLEDVVDCVSKTLRLIIAMILIKQNMRKLTAFDTCSSKDLIDQINGVMIELGLQQVPEVSYDYNNEFSIQDWCVVKYIETYFPEY